jgi:hypothetical protein
MAVDTMFTATDGRDRELWEADNEGGIAESIQCFMEGQASSQSYDLAPRSPSPPRPPVSKLHRRHKGRLRKRDNLLTGDVGEGGGRGAESYDRKKAWFFVNHSILCGT